MSFNRGYIVGGQSIEGYLEELGFSLTEEEKKERKYYNNLSLQERVRIGCEEREKISNYQNQLKN